MASCILALTGSYEQLTNYVVFADWIFFGLTVLTVLTFRRSLPLSRRSSDAFRTPGYPLLPIAFGPHLRRVYYWYARTSSPSATTSAR